MRLLPCLLLVLLPACGQHPAVPPAEEPVSDQRPISAPLDEVATLAGEWRVAGIDGQPLDQPVGLAISASDREIWWEPRCAGFARSYTIDGLRIATGPALGAPPPPSPGEPPPPVCAIGLPPRLAEVFRALEQADRVGRTRENGVAISGPGHSVLLFGQ